MTKYLTAEDICLFLDLLQRRKVDLSEFDESKRGQAERKLAEFHNETMDTVIAQYRQVAKEAGYIEESITS